jgi:hypothetical protein
MHGGTAALAVALLGLAVPASRGLAQAVPADSALATACAAGGGLAEGLLVVEFRSDVTPARRAAMAQEAGGRLAGGVSDAGPDEHYIALPPEGRALLDAAADRLIRMDGVESVGGLTCPPPPAPADTAAADTSAADTSAARPPAAPADSIRAADAAAAP